VTPIIHESLDHAILPELRPPMSHSFRLVGKPIHEIDQLSDPTRMDSCFPLLHSPHAFTMA
jgi:hypothetical protein